EHPRKHRFGIDTVGLASVIELETVAQRRQQDRTQVVKAHIVTTMKQRMALGSEHETLRAARTDPEPDILFDFGWRIGAVALGAPDETRHHAPDTSSDWHRADKFLSAQDIVGREHAFRQDGGRASRQVEDGVKLVLARESHHAVEQETIDLRLGKLIGA